MQTKPDFQTVSAKQDEIYETHGIWGDDPSALLNLEIANAEFEAYLLNVGWTLDEYSEGLGDEIARLMSEGT